MPIAGRTGMKTWSTPALRTLMTRAVGPPHGSIFITPAASATIAGRTSGLIPSRRCTGSSAVMEMRNVVAPSPSNATSIVRAAVTRQRRTGSPWTKPSRRSISGVNSPASIMSPKYSTANMIRAATGATVFSPSMAKAPTWPLKPPATAAASGVRTRAAITGVLVSVTSARNTPIVTKPRIASIARSLPPGQCCRECPYLPKHVSLI